MREFLEDAHQHHDAGIGRAQASARQTELPKRFYKETGVAETPEGFTVTLDGRPPRTPGITWRTCSWCTPTTCRIASSPPSWLASGPLRASTSTR